MTDEEVLMEGLRVVARIIAREVIAEANATPHEEGPMEVAKVEPEKHKEPTSGGGLVSAKEVAEHLDLPVSSIWALTRSNKIAYYKIGKNYRYDLEEVMHSIRVDKSKE